MSKLVRIAVLCTTFSLISTSIADNLSQIYQLALQNDASLQAAKATYEAAKENVPIARAGVLPNLTASGNTTLQRTGDNPRYNSNAYSLTLTQPLFNWGTWKSYDRSFLEVQQAAITYEQAKQTLILTVAEDYFNVLEAQAKLRFAEKYLAQLNQRLKQAEQMYKVGLKALTDVQTARASYESAKADVVSAHNAVQTALAQLETVTGRPILTLSPLIENLPLLSPEPADMAQWVTAAEKWNLQLQNDRLQAKIDHAAIGVAVGGTSSTPGYLPTANLTLTHNHSTSHGSSFSNTITNSAALSASYSLFNGGSTYANVQQAKYTYKADVATAENTRLQTDSNTRQSYLNVLSDISQIKALKQALISGEASLKASRAAYQVGTRTIVDLLTEESNLFSTQQQYADAVYNYITDSLKLKQVTGILTERDIDQINKWLELPQKEKEAPAATKQTSKK